MILLVEDDVAIGRSIQRGLGASGHVVHWVRQAEAVPALVVAGGIDVVILDVGLPDGDGFALCRDLRARGHNLPILMLTARGTLDDRLEGFEAGADDYLPKPFAFAELVARIGVLERRAAQLPPPPVKFGPLVGDPLRGLVTCRDQPLAVEPRPMALLLALVMARGELVARDTLIDSVWGLEAAITGNALDVAISAARKGLAETAPEIAIRVVRAQGYHLAFIDQGSRS